MVSSSQTCLPYQDLNCQQGDDFALFHQIGFMIIMMMLLCCGYFHCVPNTIVSWQVHITTNKKHCNKCFQRVSIKGKTMISLAYLIDSPQINFIISSVKNFSNNETGGSTVFSTGSGRVHLKPVVGEMSE